MVVGVSMMSCRNKFQLQSKREMRLDLHCDLHVNLRTQIISDSTVKEGNEIGSAL
jgi:hypothetical protein